MQADWRERAAKFGITPEAISAARAAHAVEGKTPSNGERVMQVATENTAVARGQDLAYCAAVLAQEGGGAKEGERLMAEAKSAAIELKKEVTYEIETENGIRVKSIEKIGYTTPEIQRAERAVAEWAQRNSGAGNHAVESRSAAAIDKHGTGRAAALASTNKAVADINQAASAQIQARGELQGGRVYNALQEAGTDPWDRTEKRHMEKTEFAPGDRVVYSGRNDKKEAINRSDTATVVSLSEKAVTVKLDKDGSIRQIDPERQDLRHAYALTVHKAQGVTPEKAVIYLQGQNMSREMGYVQVSRARGETEFVTTRTQVEKLARDAPPSRETAALIQAVEKTRIERGQAPSL